MTIDDLLPDPRNPRSITEAAADGLGASMQELGDLSGITWNRATGELVAGHRRVEQLRKAGATVIEEDAAGPFLCHPKSGEVFRIRVVDWDRDRQLLGNLAANNPGIQGEFTADVDVLLAEAQESFPDLYDEMRLGEIADISAGLHMPSDGDMADAFGALPSDERSQFRQMTFTVTAEQKEAIDSALSAAKDAGDFVATGNENSNGNALARICEAYRG